MEKILLVNIADELQGSEEKLLVHRLGLLHRAFSILVFNFKGEMLIQRRALHKYHSGGLWSNACCSHQREGELLDEAVHRRMREELGFNCNIEKVFSFSYKTKFDNGLVENEIDHVFIGISNENPQVNKEEVMGYKWTSLDYLNKDIKDYPERYSYWFRVIIQEYSHVIKDFLAQRIKLHKLSNS